MSTSVRSASKSPRSQTVLLSLGAILFVTCDSAKAGSFLPWCSGTTSGLVVGGLAASGIGAPVAVAGGIAEAAGLVGTWAGLDPGQPTIFLPPAPSPLGTVAASSFLNADYQPIPLPGDQFDTLITLTNNVVASMNAVTSDVRSGASRAQVVADGQALGAAVLNTAAAYDAVTSFSVDQAQLNAAIAQIAATGLPAPEVSFLQAAGWSNADIASLGVYVGSQTYNLAVPSVSFSDCAVCTGRLLVPEPSTDILVGLALFALVAGCRKRSLQGRTSRR